MPDRKVQVDEGTIGSSPCEVVLEKLLRENLRCVRKVTNLLHEFRTGLNKLRSLEGLDRKFVWQLSLLWFDDHKRRIDQLELPEVIRTHLHTCLKANWRSWLKTKKEAA